MQIRDVVIIGAGPSGLFCAAHLPKNKRVLLLEKSSISASKLLMSAQGRGNLTNTLLHPLSDYQTSHPAFVAKIFQSYTVRDFLAFLTAHDIAFHEEDNGRILLTSRKVSLFRDFLLHQVSEQGGEILYHQDFQRLEKTKQGYFILHTLSDVFYAKQVVLATGSPSFPQLGSSEIALQVAKDFQLTFIPFYPALVGVETEKNLSFLAGSSVVGKGALFHRNTLVYQQVGPVLFTHWGLSGPVIFNSTLAMQGLPPEQFTFKLSLPKAAITKRLLAYLGFSAPKLAHYTLTTKLHRLRPLTEAKVCGGGICGEQLTEQLEVKTVPGLFITGECLDVTGKTGGYNLQRCWTSGKVVAQALIANS